VLLRLKYTAKQNTLHVRTTEDETAESFNYIVNTISCNTAATTCLHSYSAVTAGVTLNNASG